WAGGVGGGGGGGGGGERAGLPGVRGASIGLAVSPGLRVGLPSAAVRAAITSHRADLVHLAGPVMLGASAGSAARQLGLPVVAVYATDMAAYARAYRLGGVGGAVSCRYLRRVRHSAPRTLAPCSASAAALA